MDLYLGLGFTSSSSKSGSEPRIFSLVFHGLSVQSGTTVLSHGGLLCSQEGWFEEEISHAVFNLH